MRLTARRRRRALSLGAVVLAALVALSGLGGALAQAAGAGRSARRPAPAARAKSTTSIGKHQKSTKKRRSTRKRGSSKKKRKLAVSVTAPVVKGSAVVGQKLTTTTGTWSSQPSSYSYGWVACDPQGYACAVITGANASSYTVQATVMGDTIRSVVTAVMATKAKGMKRSAPTAAVTETAPANTATPTISGTAQQGHTLTASQGTWTESPTGYGYSWEDCAAGSCTPIAGASTTSANYAVQSTDVGHTIEVVVSATNAAGTGKATTAPTPTVLPPLLVNVSVPVITGTPQAGDKLSASPGTWSGPATGYGYTWQDCSSSGKCATIGSASTSSGTYTLAASDVGSTVVVSVDATNAAGSALVPATSSPTGVIQPNPASVPPVDQTLPTIVGTAQVGATVKASTGSWSGGPTSFSYLWELCTATGCSAISGASTTSGQFVVPAADLSDKLEVSVTASNGAGAGTAATSAQTSPVLPAAPADTAAPTITGTAVVGDTLTAHTGSWSGSPTYSYTWEACAPSGSCTAISGASSTSGTYVVSSATVGDTIEVVVTATNAGGSASATSAATATVTGGSSGGGGSPGSCSSPCIAKPVVSGTAAEGDTLAVSPGSWNNSPGAYTYQWEDCNASGTGCASIASGSNVTSYVVQPSDAGHTLVAAVTDVTSGSKATATSASTAVVATGGPSDSVAPAVSGTATAGSVLTASPGTWSGTGLSYSYQWNDCLVGGGNCMAISGATGASYTVKASDEGFAVDVAVTASNGSGSQAVPSAVTSAVPVPPSNIGISIAGLAVLGSTLSVEDHWAGSNLSYSYQWLDCNSAGAACSNISGATSATYVVAAGDQGHTVEVTVKTSNAGGSASATSSPTAAIQTPTGSGVPASTGAPTISGTPGEGDPLTAAVGTWSGSPTSYAFQWQDCTSAGTSCSNVASGTGTSYVYVPTSQDVGHTLRFQITAKNGSGSATSVSAVTAAVTALGATSPGGLTIVGDKLVDSAGAVVLPHGVDRSGSEYACWQFDAVSDGPIDAPSTAAMSTWNVNMVRVQLNEDCWLGIDGVPANVSGANYINAIKAWVNILHQYGIYAYISLMSGHPGTEPPDNNEPNAPDEDHSPLYWEQLATTFRGDSNVILAPQSELSSSTVDWNCYINGCSNEASSPNTTGGPFDGAATCYSSSTPDCGYYYRSAGMKQAVQIMRAAGYNGPIGIPCVNWADECAAYDGQGTLGGTWQSEVPSIDPDHQVMAEIHSYTNESVCASASCYNATLSPILSAGYPVIFGEFGENNDCAADAGGITSIMPWAASNGVGWLSFAWDVYGFCTLISSYEPATPYAGGYAGYVQGVDQAQPG